MGEIKGHGPQQHGTPVMQIGNRNGGKLFVEVGRSMGDAFYWHSYKGYIGRDAFFWHSHKGYIGREDYARLEFAVFGVYFLFQWRIDY